MASPLVTQPLFHVGPVPITGAVLTTWALMVVLAGASWLTGRRLAQTPGRWQALLELAVTAIADHIRETMRTEPARYLPLIGTLLIFLASANLLAIVPGLEPPTGQIETPAALALVVFGAVHYFGVCSLGLRGYLAAFAKPAWIMLPLNLVSEVTRTFSLMVRLFGNVMSGAFVIGIVLSLAGLLVPIPLMALELLTGLVQAYIFTVLAMVFIASAIGIGEQA